MAFTPLHDRVLVERVEGEEISRSLSLGASEC